MLVLHASFLGDRLYFWGESSDIIYVSSKKQSFLFDAGHKRLLLAMGLSEQKDCLEKETMLVWMPSCNGRPIVSSSLIDSAGKTVGKVSISPFLVSAVSLSADAFIPMLCEWIGKKKIDTGILLGNDIVYWTWVLRFAQSLVYKQQFLPSLDQNKIGYYATWKPLFLGEDQEKLATLAKKMPGACRAMTQKESFEVPCFSSIEVLRDFAEIVCNAMIRSQSEPAKTSNKKKTFDSIHDQWLHALTSSSAQISGTEKELKVFAEQMANWQKPLFLSSDSPFRLCLRLDEPEEVQKTPSWKVNYFLQDCKDPSLLVPASHAWKSGKQKASLLKRDNFQPKEYLLASLGEVARVWPDIEKSLRTSEPESHEINTKEAYQFLAETAWILKQMGFSVLLPAWWSGKGTKDRLSAKAKVLEPLMKNKGKLSLDQIVDVQWEIALGDQSISIKELQALAKMKSSLVKFRGKWIHIDEKEIQAALKLWEKSSEKLTVKDCIQMSLGARQESHNLDIAGIEFEGQLKDFLGRLQSPENLDELETSRSFSGNLRPYQKRGYAWLEFLSRFGLGACLADDMGLGKTIQALALLLHLKESGEKRPALLICPTSVTSNWMKESARFAPKLNVLLHHGIQRKKDKSFFLNIARYDLVVSSYSLLHRDIEVFQQVDWSGIILDEAQNIKNSKTKQSQAARILKADYRIALTGTPVENNVGELWPLMEFLNPGFMGTEADFKDRFFVPIQFHHDRDAMEDLKRLTGPFLLRRLKTDKSIIKDLPDKIETKVYCKLTKEQGSLYEAVLQDTMEKIEDAEGIERKGIILASILKLKQICNHPLQFLKDNSSIQDRSGKLLRLHEILEEILEGEEKSLIFTQFVEMGEILKKDLQENFGEEVLFLHGQVERKKRQEMVDAFQDQKGPRLFLLSLKAGGTGLNLTRATHVFHFDRWWNPSVENQATDRAFRIGQTRNVQVHKFLCSGTMEEKIDNMIEDKKEIAENVIGTGEAWLTELSTKQLREILTLNQDAMRE